MARIKCTVAYDGFNYMGFQVQGDLDTIESRLVNAIKEMTGKIVKIYPSGRTDRYVNAKAQVFHFDTDLEIRPYGWKSGINDFLPVDIHITDVEIVDESFHARFSALKKEYRYYIRKTDYDVFTYRYAPYIPKLDVSKMAEALNAFVGTHDFKGFASAQIDKRKDTVKTIYEVKLNEYDDFLEFIFIGSGFLKYQVRRMMGIIIEIGRGKENIDKILQILENPDPSVSHKIADGRGLFLEKVYY